MVLLVPHSYRNALVRGVAFKCGQAILSYQRVEIGAEIAASRLRARSSALADHRVSRRQVVSHVKELGGHHEQANISARVRDCCALSIDGPRAEQRQLRRRCQSYCMYAQLKHRHLEPAVHPNRRRDRMCVLDTTIKTSNGNGVTLLITPSAVTGLFTSTRLSQLSPRRLPISVSKCACRLRGTRATQLHSQCSRHELPRYDQRFQQISNTLFANVATCAAGNAGTICTSDANCTGGTICGPPDLTGTQTCTCGFDLTLSTLSAHSFNFIAQVPGTMYPTMSKRRGSSPG